MTTVFVLLAAALSAGLGSGHARVDSSALRTKAASLEMPVTSLTEIAADFDDGRNRMYCFFGQRETGANARVKVDSIAAIETPAECLGIGLGFVTRIADPVFLSHVLRGLVSSMPRFGVVSAFYQTEDIERNGKQVHVARALSVIRGVPVATSVGAS